MKKLYLSTNILHIRQLAGKTQDEFAAMVGSSKDKIYTYENGKVKNPPQLVMLNIAKLAGITLDELYNQDIREYNIDVLNPDTKKVEFQLNTNNRGQQDVKRLQQENEDLKKQLEQERKEKEDLMKVVLNLSKLKANVLEKS